MFLENSTSPKFYGRRKGRTIRKAKSTLLEAFLPQIKLQNNFNKQTMFGYPVNKVYLEIGFGDGQHLAGQALKNPEIGFIGAEVFKNGIANLLTIITGIKQSADLPENITISKERKDNIRIFDDDVRLLLSSIPDAFLDKIFLLFPDPWPKKRHANRRFVNHDNLVELARILKKGGILRIATDHKVYKSWALRQVCKFQPGSFKWTATCSNDWRNEPKDWVKTKYQMKAIKEGRRPVFLDFERI